MAATAENPKDDKPVIVRVKRKASQFCLDAFWLEINERPLKRQLVDFEKLSISESSSTKVEELKTKKILVQHVETITNSEVTADLVRSFVPDSADSSIIKEKFEERRHAFKANNHMQRQDQLLTKAKQKQEDLSKNARFEQIWKSRREKKDDEALHEVCRLYDVVRVDTEEKSHDVQEEDPELEDHRMMSQYLPLLREVMPSAAEEIESDIHDYIFKRASSDGFVYDFYAVKNDVETMAESTANHFPLVQVDDDDDFYDGPDDSDYETDDSNDENNPRNDYPDEESSGDDGEVESLSSNDRSEAESKSSSDEQETDIYVSREGEDLSRYECSDGGDPFVEDDIYSGDAGDEGSRGSSHWSLERLPDSIINELLLKLDLESLCTAACVSRSLRSAVSQVLASRSSLDLSAFYPDTETLQRILGRLKGVKSLTIDCLRVDDFSFINILGGQIEELNLLKCSSRSHHILGTIGQRCPNLRVLLIEIAWQRLPQLIKSLVVMLKNISYLESLSLKIHGTAVDVYDFQPVYHSLPTTLKTLKLLPVHEQHFIHSILKFRDDRHLLAPVPSFSNPLHSHGACFNLRNLSLALHVISDELMFSIVESLPCLVELDLEDRPYLEPQMPRDLSNIGLQSLGALQYLTTLSIIRNKINLPVSFKRVNDLGMFILVESCRGLESVKLGGFSKVTDAGFSSILHSCQKLKKFEVRNASLLSDLAFHDMQKVASSLVELRLLSCNLLTSEALEELSSFGKLEVLDMSGCRSIANPCLSFISSLSTLTNLTLAGADITDDGLAIFGRGSSSMITHLCLKSCKRISEKGIHKLFHGEGKIGNKLLFLDISYMPGISDAAIATITSAAKALTDLCMRYCFFVTNAALKMLASRGTLHDGSALLRRLDLCHCSGLSNDLIQILDKSSFPGLHWLGLGSTALKTRKDDFDVMFNSRPWLTVCFDDCELGCHDGWMF